MPRIDIASRAFLTGVILLIGVNILALLGTRVDQTTSENFHRLCQNLSELEAYRDSQVLQLSLGLVGNYDDINQAGENARRLLAELRRTIGVLPQGQKIVLERAVSTMESEQESRQTLVQAFATDNASLASSRKFLPVLIAKAGDLLEDHNGRDAHLELRKLGDEIAAFILIGKDVDTSEWKSRLSALQLQTSNPELLELLGLVRAHSQLILTAEPSVDASIRDFLLIHPSQFVGRLREQHKLLIEQRAARQSWLKVSLYLGILVLITGALAVHRKAATLSVQLQTLNHTLEQDVAQRTSELTLEMSVHRDAERELVKARDAAEAGNRAKSEFMARMSHEIRTPMNGVIGFTELLLDTPLNEDQARHVHTIRSSGEGLLLIINDILDFSKLDAGKLEVEKVPFDLADPLEQTVALLQPIAERKGITLGLRKRGLTKTIVLADPGRTRQVLMNLVSNALKFTEKGGVTLEVESGEGLTMVRVTDTGIGIPADHHTRLFQRFSQADSSTTRKFGGTGLGLVISKRLIELMGGSIGFESSPGLGSTFWFTLPQSSLQVPVAGVADSCPAKSQKPSATHSQSDLATPSSTPSSIRVLAVEDNPTNQILLERLLLKKGCIVEIAANGKEAVDRFAAQHYDLIFMDYQMPIMDGLAATREIRKIEEQRSQRDAKTRRYRTPIIALTANAMEGDRSACMSAGMDDYLSKPIRSKELTEALQRWTQAGSARGADASTKLLPDAEGDEDSKILP